MAGKGSFDALKSLLLSPRPTVVFTIFLLLAAAAAAAAALTQFGARVEAALKGASFDLKLEASIMSDMQNTGV